MDDQRPPAASPELVVLCDETGAPTGTADKATVHSRHTPLHLAFSCYLFNPQGLLLVTRRALGKAAWPGVWTNSFCGHPGPGEDPVDALARRAGQELGVGVDAPRRVLPDFRYRAVDAAGIVEHEICPVFCATADGDPAPSAEEVAEWRWVAPEQLAAAVAAAPWAFSPWLGLQLPQLQAAEPALFGSAPAGRM